MELHDDLPGLRRFIGVSGSKHNKPRDRAQRCELLDGLMRRAVLADTDRIVREDVDHRQLHQRGQADRGTAIVAEDQEPGAVGPDLDPCHTVEDRPHGRLTDAEVEVAAGIAVRRLEVAGTVESQSGFRRWSQVGRAGHQPSDIPGDCVQDQSRRVPSGHSLVVGGEGSADPSPSRRGAGDVAFGTTGRPARGIRACSGPIRLNQASRRGFHGCRCLHGNARRRRQGRGTWRPRASGNSAW